MKQLEEDFVMGVWSPPFSNSVAPLTSCNTAEPPSKRRQQKKNGKENNQPQAKGKTNKLQQKSGRKKKKQPGISRSFLSSCLLHR